MGEDDIFCREVNRNKNIRSPHILFKKTYGERNETTSYRKS